MKSKHAGGTWSLTRPGVFFTTRQDGALDVWDLYFKHQEPTLQVQVSDKPLTCLANTHSGEYLAVGSDSGSCAVLQLSKSVWTCPKEEKASINAMFEREGLRCDACYASLYSKEKCTNLGVCMCYNVDQPRFCFLHRKVNRHSLSYCIYVDQLHV
jgi:WD40 repeat protein